MSFSFCFWQGARRRMSVTGGNAAVFYEKGCAFDKTHDSHFLHLYLVDRAIGDS